MFRFPDQLDQLHQTLELRPFLLHVHAPTIQDDDGQMMTVRKYMLIMTDMQCLSCKGCISFTGLPRDASSLAGNGARKSGTRLGNDGSAAGELLAAIETWALMLALNRRPQRLGAAE